METKEKFKTRCGFIHRKYVTSTSIDKLINGYLDDFGTYINENSSEGRKMKDLKIEAHQILELARKSIDGEVGDSFFEKRLKEATRNQKDIEKLINDSISTPEIFVYISDSIINLRTQRRNKNLLNALINLDMSPFEYESSLKHLPSFLYRLQAHEEFKSTLKELFKKYKESSRIAREIEYYSN